MSPAETEETKYTERNLLSEDTKSQFQETCSTRYNYIKQILQDTSTEEKCSKDMYVNVLIDYIMQQRFYFDCMKGLKSLSISG